jgi:UPF0042 nucleotide-binding protein
MKKGKGTPLVIITGMSGAGKSTALRCFEDLGYFCVDNLPPALIGTFYRLSSRGGEHDKGITVGCDVRSGALFGDFDEALAKMRDDGLSVRVIFLDCGDDELISRFQESRRAHPLSNLPAEGVAKERVLMAPIKSAADEVIDTSELSAAQLRDEIFALFAGGGAMSVTTVTLVSFGYRFGIPTDCDFVFDVRFLPNPFYESELQDLTGTDKRVFDYVMSDPKAAKFADGVYDLISVALPGFAELKKLNLAAAFGCTGGQHRSVAMAEYLRGKFTAAGVRALVVHRDTGKV